MGTQPARAGETPEITILVALYKAGEFIEAKIKNLRNLTNIQQCKVIFLNCQDLDNESKHYEKFLEDYPQSTHIIYNKHRKVYGTWNEGIKMSDTKYIANFNADDQCRPDYFEKCIQFLEEYEEYCAVSSRVLVSSFPNQVWPEWTKDSELPPATYPDSTAGPCPVWRRSLHSKYGYFDDLRVVSDATMWQRWHEGGEKFGYINDPMVLYYRSPNSLERRIDPKTKLPYRHLDLDEIAARREKDSSEKGQGGPQKSKPKAKHARVDNKR